jgi:hypothetical protein
MRIGPLVIQTAKQVESRRKELEKANKISDRSNIIKNKMLAKLLHENFIMRGILKGGVYKGPMPQRGGERTVPLYPAQYFR